MLLFLIPINGHFARKYLILYVTTIKTLLKNRNRKYTSEKEENTKNPFFKARETEQTRKDCELKTHNKLSAMISEVPENPEFQGHRTCEGVTFLKYSLDEF